MKSLYKYILVSIICVFIYSCDSQIDELYKVSDKSKLELIGVPADFSRMNVDSRATLEQENEIKDLTLFIFNSEGTLAGRAFKVDGNVMFTIDLENGNVIYGTDLVSLGNNLESCTIYMFANVWSSLKDVITTKGNSLSADDLLSQTISVSSIDIPDDGFPMMGMISGVNLSSSATSASLNVPLEKLFAKVNVTFQVSADKVDQIPTFKLNNWSVWNVPSEVSFSGPYNDKDELVQTIAAEDSEIVFNSQRNTRVSSGQNTITHSSTLDGSSMFTLTFYVPEHVVIPNSTEDTYNGFPDGLPITERQRYKPMMFDRKTKFPTYVLIEGEYKDHFGQLIAVQYNLYLGQDNTDDFSIFRNQQLDNNVVIRGLTNSADVDNVIDDISVDHRVNILSKGYSIAIERELFLDSHFELRPIDITVQAGAKVVLEIEDDENSLDDDWVRFDESNEVQDYFYEDLVTKTLKDNKRFELDNTNNADENSQRIWIYIDENTQHYDKLVSKVSVDDPRTKTYREKTIVVKYYKTKESEPEIYNFKLRQMNLWRIWGGKGIGDNATKNRFYDIEYYEEYLYNYASDDNWGKTTDGMAWGFYNTTFSGNMGDDLKTQAILLDVTSMGLTQSIGQWVIKQASPYYDFYLPREAQEISNDLVNDDNAFAGRRFTSAMISYQLQEKKIKLSQDTNSALEYCLNKNKRFNAPNNDPNNGTVKTQSWYLPAIDELEEIMVGGYSDFSVFQDKKYWSCQPAYHRSYVHYKTVDYLTKVDYGGAYYFENNQFARVSSAKYVGKGDDDIDQYTYLGSGAINDGYYQYFPVSVSDQSGTQQEINGSLKISFKTNTTEGFLGSLIGGKIEREDITLKEIEYDSGYRNRNEVNRVRCVRNSGYDTKPGS